MKITTKCHPSERGILTFPRKIFFLLYARATLKIFALRKLK